MADLGGIECAAGVWLQRLRRGEALLPSETLDILRRKEIGARQRAEALASAEGRCAKLATERLEDERRLNSRCSKALQEAQNALEVERKRRLDVEVALTGASEERRRAEEELATEATRRVAAEEALKSARDQLFELRRLVADDHSLRVLDEFREKFQSQRSEIETLQQRLELQGQTVASTESSLRRAWKDSSLARERWDAERAALVSERDAARKDLGHLCEAGASLQSAAEVVLNACASAAAAAAIAKSTEACHKPSAAAPQFCRGGAELPAAASAASSDQDGGLLLQAAAEEVLRELAPLVSGFQEYSGAEQVARFAAPVETHIRNVDANFRMEGHTQNCVATLGGFVNDDAMEAAVDFVPGGPGGLITGACM